MKKYLLTCFALVFALSLWAQERTISGKVTATEDGSALPGVNVLIKGTTNGTVTDSDGNYKLTISTAGSSLVFSFIGLATAEVPIGERTVVDVSLGLDVTQLSEVVVTGTGVATEKRRLGIAVESISSKDLPQIAVQSIDQALVGKIAGAQIFSSSGNPGAPVSIQLRGINTLTAGTQPLIMVDGVELRSSSLNSLDLSNVERVEVVQGASAATIYGAQGANGVIQIFTKKGKEGPMKIEASARFSTDEVLNIGGVHQPFNNSFVVDANGDILQTGGGLLTQNAIGIWGTPTWQRDAAAKNENSYKNNTQYNDHLDQLFNKATTTGYNVSLSGGKQKTDYSFNFAKFTQESVIQGTLDRNNISINIGTELLPKLTMRFINQLVFTNSSVNQTSPPISSALYTYPFVDLAYKGSDGHYLYKFGTGAGVNNTNPLYFIENQTYSDKRVDVIPSVNFHYDLPKFLSLDYKVGANAVFGNFSRNTVNQSTYNGYLESKYFTGFPDGQFEKEATTSYNINSLATAIVNIDFAKDFNSSIPLISTTQVAYDWRRAYFHRNFSYFVGLPVYSGIDDVNGAQASSKSANEFEDQFVTYGFVVNEKLEYKEMLGVSGGFRTDYSSVYGESKTPFTFPRGDAYLRVSKFQFWDGISSLIPELKLRVAYGEAGIQPASYYNTWPSSQSVLAGAMPYHFLRIPTFNPGTVDNGSTLSINPASSNPALQVEVSKEFDYGLDFGFKPIKDGKWLSFINASVDLWTRTGQNLVWSRPVAVSSGAETIWDNYVDIESKGFQFSLNLDIYNGDNLTWDMTTNFGNTKSTVTRTADHKEIPLSWGSAATYTLREGEQIGTVLGYKALTSINQKDLEGNFYLDQTNAANFEIVDGRVVDKTSKQVQFTSDKYTLGNTTPKFQMNFINNFTYKNFLNASFQVDWVYGQKTYNQTKEWMYSEGLHNDFDKKVTINGESAAWVAYWKSFYDASESNGTKDYFLENSSFARLRNVSVGLDFAKLFDWKKLSKVQLVFTGRNLVTITKYTGMDPEANLNTSGGGTGTAAGQTATQRGLDYWAFPNYKSYQIGLNISIN